MNIGIPGQKLNLTMLQQTFCKRSSGFLMIWRVDAAMQTMPSHWISPEKSKTSNSKSRSVADVEVLTAEGLFWEGVEVKHGIAITPTLVEDAYEKFSPTPANRFYLLTTAEPNVTESQHNSRAGTRHETGAWLRSDCQWHYAVA